MTPDPTNEACERIARECVSEVYRIYNEGAPRSHTELDNMQTQAILTAAARITALRVKATGAAKALDAASNLIAHGDFKNGVTHPDGRGPDEGEVLAQRYYEETIPQALAALRSLERGDEEDKP